MTILSYPTTADNFEVVEMFTKDYQSHLYSVADPGEGPGGSAPLFLDQSEARRAEKAWGGDRAPPYLRVWMTGPPLSQGLDPALILTTMSTLPLHDLVSKNLLANSFRNYRKRNNLAENYVRKSFTNIAKIATITNVKRFKT